MKFYPLTVGDKTYHLRIVTRDHAQLESLLGSTVMEALQDQQKLMQFKTIAIFLHVASRPLSHDHGGALTLDQAADLIDEMVDAGKSIDQLITIVMEICEASGFFPAGTMSAMEKPEQKPEKPAKA